MHDAHLSLFTSVPIDRRVSTITKVSNFLYNLAARRLALVASRWQWSTEAECESAHHASRRRMHAAASRSLLSGALLYGRNFADKPHMFHITRGTADRCEESLHNTVHIHRWLQVNRLSGRAMQQLQRLGQDRANSTLICACMHTQNHHNTGLWHRASIDQIQQRQHSSPTHTSDSRLA